VDFRLLFLAENFRDIVERDIIQRYNVEYKNVLKKLAKYYVSNSGKENSFNKIKNVFNVKSLHTIRNYSQYFSNAYLFFILEKYSPKLRLQEISPKKFIV